MECHLYPITEATMSEHHVDIKHVLIIFLHIAAYCLKN